MAQNQPLEDFDPLDPDTVECPYDFYRALRQHGGVYRVANRGFFLVSRYDTAMQVIKDTDTFSSAAGVAVPSAAELNSIVTQFLVAGNETTTNTIASGMWLLFTHPDQLELAGSDAGLIPNLVEEVLRMESPVQAHFRTATRDTELEGVHIPEGTGVGVVYGCCNRDDAKFPDAQSFDIRRDHASRHLAFSQGIHFCPGAPLARLESIVAFEHLLARLKNVRLNEERSDLSHAPSFTHRGLRALALEFD
jgi:cytochrome P450